MISTTSLVLPRITAFGDFRVAVGGMTLGFPTRKTSGVLAYLTVCESDRVAAEELVDMFWPGTGEREGRHSLAQALYTIRRVVGRMAVTGTTEIKIEKAGLSADIWDFNHAIDKLQVAVALRVFGPFLQGLEIDSPSYDAWRFSVADVLNKRITREVSAAISNAQVRNDWRSVESLSVLAAEKLPINCDYCYAHVRALLALGQPAKAQDQYTAYVELLKASVPTRSLPDWSDVTSGFDSLILVTTGNLEKDLEFIGRDCYLAELKEAFSAVESSRAQLVAISGKAGIGKTALCEHFCDWATDQGASVVQATGYEAEQHIPLNVLTDILAHCCRLIDLKTLPSQLAASIAELVPEAEYVQQGITALGPEAAHRRLLEAVTRLLATASEKCPIVVFIDDVHWVDDATLKCLSFLARRTAGKRLMLLVAARESFDQRPALTQLQRSVNSARTVCLTEFNEREASSFVNSRLREMTTQQLTREAYQMSGGHPLLLAEILKTVERKGFADPDAIDLTFVKRGIDVLPGKPRRIAEVLAVLNLPASLERLGIFLGCGTSDLGSEIESLRDFCVLEPDGNIRFTHDLIRDGVIKTLPRERVVGLHRTVAESLENLGETPAALAYHYDRCGDKTKARRYALEAAAMSDLKRAGKEALHFYQLALSHSDNNDDEFFIKGLMASSLVKAGEYVSADPVIAEILQSPQKDLRAQLKWRALALINSHAMKSNLRAKSLLCEARSVEALAQAEGDAEATLNALRVQLSLETRLLGEDHDPQILDRLLTLSERNPVTRVGAEALILVAQIMGYQGTLTSLRHVRTALAWAEQIGDTELLIKCLRTAGAVHYATGQFQGAKQFYDRAVATVQSTGAFLYYAYVFGSYASLLMELDCDSQTEQMLNMVIRDEVAGEEAEKVTAQCNRVLHAYQRGDYAHCAVLADQVLSDQAEGMWLEIAVRGVWGLSLVEMGRLAEAKEQAAKVEVLLTKSRVYGDISYGYVLLARVKSLQGQEMSLVEPLRTIVESRGSCDPVATARMKLALAEALMRRSPTETTSILNDVHQYAELHSLKALGDQCDRLSRKHRRSGFRN